MPLLRQPQDALARIPEDQERPEKTPDLHGLPTEVQHEEDIGMNMTRDALGGPTAFYSGGASPDAMRRNHMVGMDTRDRLPTATELARIRHTLDILGQSEASLRERLEVPEDPLEARSLLEVNLAHAFEVVAGWDEAARLVDKLPEEFLDKGPFLDEVDRGRCRSRSLMEAAWSRLPPPEGAPGSKTINRSGGL